MMKTYRLIVVTVLAFMLVLPATIVGAQEPAAISFTTLTPSTIKIGQEVSFDLVITVNNINPGVAGADIYVQYNSTLISVPASPTSVAEAKPDFFGASNVSVNEVTQCPGTTDSCIHLVVAGPAQVTQSGAVARFHFMGKAGGKACFKVFQSTLANANGFAVDHLKPSEQCVVVEPPTIDVIGIVSRQGTPANPNAGKGTLTCSSVTALSGSTTAATVNTGVDGKFKIEKLASGTYTFRVTYPGYLATEKSGVAVSQSVDLGSTTLRGGDVNGDNIINILDVGTIISKFGKTGLAVRSASADCSVTDDPADINDDGQVNISDLAIAAGNWQSTGPKPW